MLLILVLLLLVNALAPGFVLVRRLGWRPLEALTAAVGVSLILIYLATLGLYLSGLPMAWCFAGSAAALAWLFVFRRDLRALMRAPDVRLAGLLFLLLLGWLLAIVGIVRHFGGGGWGHDWIQHFQRCLYYLHRLPVDTVLDGPCHVTSRPPLMNVVGAYFLAQSTDEFGEFQVVFAFLNALPFLAAALFVGRWTSDRRALGILAALFATCPMFAANIVYTWTKLLSAFYVLLAVYFYLTARAEGGRAREVAWALAIAAAVLVHYSAGPFALFLAGHYLWVRVVREPPSRWPARLMPVVPGLVLLATWIVWALVHFGLSTTLTSNTSVGDSQGLSAAGNLAKMALNVVDTVVPHPLRGVPLHTIAQESRAGFVRDWAFFLYQCNLILSVGSVAGVWAAVLLVRRWRAGPRGPEHWFWAGFLPFTIVAGVATHGGRDYFGVAHVSLQPLTLMGLALVAAHWWRASRAVRAIAVAGALLDAGLGIALHHHLQSFENTAERQAFDPDVRVEASSARLEWRREQPLAASAWHGWFSKQAHPLLQRQLERSRRLPPERAQRLVDALTPEIRHLEEVDTRRWGGWYSRHQWRLTFLGDRLAGSAGLLRATVLLLWAALLLPMVRSVVGSR